MMIKEPLPIKFIESIEEILGDEARALIEALDTPPEVSVRLNVRKPGAAFDGNEQVSWCGSGLYLKERPDFIFDPLLHAGAYYVQDASSMIYETVTRNIIDIFYRDYPSSVLKVLDMCASPGGKTTAIINGLPDGCEVVANEYVKKRVDPLKENLTKWGYSKVRISNRDSGFYANGDENFDIVAVDAPCSGEGMMRKDEFARKQWSPELVNQCAALQRDILTNAVKTLKPGGFLIYSTCTFNRKENEENAEFIATQLGLKPADLDFPPEWGIPGGIDTELPVARFMPHKTRGEGLFVALFRKEGKWTPDVSRDLSRDLNTGKKSRQSIEKSEKIKGNDIPEISEILKAGKVCPDVPRIELDREDALRYLRRESITAPEGAPKGMVILTYKGLNLGAGKNIGSRINNLYPKEWRILKR